MHSDGPLRDLQEDEDCPRGVSQRRDRAAESAAPARRQRQHQRQKRQAPPGLASGRAAGAGAAQDRSAARPAADNPNLIALGSRDKIPSHDGSASQDSHHDSSQAVRAEQSAAPRPPENERPGTPRKLLHLRPYGQLTPLRDQDEDADVIIMAPAPAPLAAPNGQPGPHPSFIEVAKPYIFQQKIEQFLTAIGMPEAKEDSNRLQGVQLIDNVRKSLQLPVRTFNTACVYYHKFRLIHADNEYNLIEASLAALFTACKIEDTLKKSKEIICASFNLKLSPGEHLSPDDPQRHQQLEQPSKVIIGLERLMLEGAGFDFRNRQPQKLVIKLTRRCGFAKDRVGKTAYSMSLDLYRTFAPLKQTTAAMAIACVELAARLCGANLERIVGEGSTIDYARWRVTRAEVMGESSPPPPRKHHSVATRAREQH
ncbi:Cyclin [Macrophomina phaseolina MS6]|uniref:RNA polymerase II holoenzyme cyclin-like subunit n=1 Tax=Macrophomina phaseolina (strain MS6) TaxID=1126212 RepID=K2RI12_MACPH|nr:Cyclin [Macrophomina phaseolina MS6]